MARLAFLYRSVFILDTKVIKKKHITNKKNGTRQIQHCQTPKPKIPIKQIYTIHIR